MGARPNPANRVPLLQEVLGNVSCGFFRRSDDFRLGEPDSPLACKVTPRNARHAVQKNMDMRQSGFVPLEYRHVAELTSVLPQPLEVQGECARGEINTSAFINSNKLPIECEGEEPRSRDTESLRYCARLPHHTTSLEAHIAPATPDEQVNL